MEEEENGPANGNDGKEAVGVRDGWMDGWSDKTQTTAAEQRAHIPSKKGRDGEQAWFRGAEKRLNNGGQQKNGGGGLWLSGLLLGWS